MEGRDVKSHLVFCGSWSSAVWRRDRRCPECETLGETLACSASGAAGKAGRNQQVDRVGAGECLLFSRTPFPGAFSSLRLHFWSDTLFPPLHLVLGCSLTLEHHSCSFPFLRDPRWPIPQGPKAGPGHLQGLSHHSNSPSLPSPALCHLCRQGREKGVTQRVLWSCTDGLQFGPAWSRMSLPHRVTSQSPPTLLARTARAPISGPSQHESSSEAPIRGSDVLMCGPVLPRP